MAACPACKALPDDAQVRWVTGVGRRVDGADDVARRAPRLHVRGARRQDLRSVGRRARAGPRGLSAHGRKRRGLAHTGDGRGLLSAAGDHRAGKKDERKPRSHWSILLSFRGALTIVPIQGRGLRLGPDGELAAGRAQRSAFESRPGCARSDPCFLPTGRRRVLANAKSTQQHELPQTSQGARPSAPFGLLARLTPPPYASAPVTTLPLVISCVMVAAGVPTAASIVCPNEASDSAGAMSPLVEPAPVFESMAIAP